MSEKDDAGTTSKEEGPTRQFDVPREAPIVVGTPTVQFKVPRVISQTVEHDLPLTPRRVYASPTVRRLAREYAIDISEIRGSGRNGRITRDDVLAHLTDDVRTTAPIERPKLQDTVTPVEVEVSMEPAPHDFVPTVYDPPVVEARDGDGVVPLSRRQRVVAEHMRYSKMVSPHAAAVLEIDVHRVLRALAGSREPDRDGSRLLARVCTATIRALRTHPALNSVVTEEAHILRRDIHLGISVHVDGGPVVPVVHHADRLDADRLSAAIVDVMTRAREKRLTVDDMAGGTFTVSMAGRDGSLFGIAIINQPQVGALQLGRVVKRPVVDAVRGEDHIVVRPMMYLSLSFDHRVIDGAIGDAFLHTIKAELETPPGEVA